MLEIEGALKILFLNFLTVKKGHSFKDCLEWKPL